MEDIIFDAADEAMEMNLSRQMGKIALGKVTQMVLYIEIRYAAMGLAITGWGTSKAGEAALRFTTSTYNTVIFRFNGAENLLKFNTDGKNYGIPHHQQLSTFVQEMMQWASENGI